MDKLTKLPESFKPLLWSYNFEAIDPQKDKREVIVQIINYGKLDQWKWLVNYYGKEDIKGVLTTIPASELRPQARALAGTLFGIQNFNYAPRGSHKRS